MFEVHTLNVRQQDQPALLFIGSICLPPALAEEVMFSVPSVCVCPSVCLRSTGWTVRRTDLNFGTHIKGHRISDKFEGQRSRSPTSKNVKIPVYSLVSENMVRGQRARSQGSRSKVTKVKVKGCRSRSQGQGQWWVFSPHRLAGGSTHGRFHHCFLICLRPPARHYTFSLLMCSKRYSCSPNSWVSINLQPAAKDSKSFTCEYSKCRWSIVPIWPGFWGLNPRNSTLEVNEYHICRLCTPSTVREQNFFTPLQNTTHCPFL